MRAQFSVSLVKRLNIIILPIIALGFFILAGITIYIEYSRIMSDVSSKISNTLDLARISLSEPIWNLNQNSIDDIRDSLLLDDDVVAVMITDEAGMIFSLKKSFDYTDYRFRELKEKPNMKEWTVKVTYFNQVIGIVHIITSNKRALNAVKQNTLMTLAITALIVILLGLLISYLGIRYVKRPVDSLTKKAIALSQGDLSTEINTTRKDELGTLAKSFAEMREAIRTKIIELEQLNDSLEKRVDDRTKELSEALVNVEESKIAAEMANEAKTEFLANMSHELRTPMHGILGFAKLGKLKADLGNTKKAEEYFSIIQKNGERLLKLLNDLLDLSKLEMGKQSYQLRKERLLSLVEKVIKEQETLINEKKLTIKIDVRTENDFVYVDPDKIVQVIGNLLANAIKFSPQKSYIDIYVGNSENHVIFGISDNGIGIPEDELESVFDKFAQSRKTKTGAGGTGLGLSISKKIIQDHLGEIWAENNRKGGAAFTVKLPKDIAQSPSIEIS